MGRVDWPVYEKKVILQKMAEVLDANRWSITGYWSGQQSQEQQFVKKFALYNKVRHCVLTTNGTAALQIALEALDIGYGDEVIVPALTWLATATAVLNVNAKPVFADADPFTFCIDPVDIENKITQNTKAIIVVHLYGSVCDMDTIMAIAKKHNLHVIEDCAQAHGSEWKEKKVGTIGDLGCFSMQDGKTLTGGEGGAVITNDTSLYERLYQLRTDSRMIKTEGLLQYGDMEVEEWGNIQGNNFCLSEFNCAVLNCQLEKLDNEHSVRFKNALFLENELKRLGFIPQQRLSGVTYPTFYGFAFLVPSSFQAETLVDRLRTSLHLGSFFIHHSYPPVNQNAIYCPWTKRRFCHLKLSEEEIRNAVYPNAQKIAAGCIVLHHSVLLHRDVIEALVCELEKTV